MARRKNLAAAIHSSAKISIGPYLIRSPENDLFAPGIPNAGWALELAGDAFATRVNIYRRVEDQEEEEEEPVLDDFLVPLNQIPFRVGLMPGDLISVRNGELVSLESVLVSLYRDHEVSRSIESFLPELLQTFSFQDRYLRRRALRPGELLVSKVAAAGFELLDFWQYGATLSVRIGWNWAKKLDASAEPLCYYAGTMEFRPTPARTLGKGKWIEPMQTTIYYLLFQKLRSLLRGDPQHWLAVAGHEVALQEFKWTKFSLLTRAELKQARVEFVRQNPQLHSQLRELARALRAAELYTEHTELYAIVKQLPQMLHAATWDTRD